MSVTSSSAVSNNTVSSNNQLASEEYVSFECNGTSSYKVLFVGCSITKHGPKADIGWNHDWGMAASAKENDYVHQIMKCVRSLFPDAGFCIAQAAQWEQHYQDGITLLEKYYKRAVDFDADLIIMNSTGNNTSVDSVKKYPFALYYEQMIDFLNHSGKAHVVVMTSFYDTPLNEIIRTVAEKRNFSLVELVEIGKKDEMKAFGTFEHSGVASHPGDLGMAAIAEAIWGPVQNIITEHQQSQVADSSKNVDKIRPLTAGQISLQGRLGDKLRLSIKNRLKKIDYSHLVEPFRLRNETDGRWRCEFWGKIVRSAILSWRGQADAELLQLIKDTVRDLISTQTKDGCISSYPYDLQTNDWDIWGRKYVLIGLARYYLEIEKSEEVKKAMTDELDYIISQVGPKAKDIVECGHHNGMAASSILEPVVLVYRVTGEKRFLDYALWIVSRGGSNLNNIFTDVIKGTPPSKLGNAKAYEMMSCFEGLAELYRETANPDYMKAILTFYSAVRDQEIFVTGVGGLKDTCGEFWDKGKIKQTQFNVGALGETCVTTTWIKFCGQILRLSNDATVVDEMERTLYNGVLGAMLPDASWWMHRNPTPLAGASSKVRAGDQIPGYGEDCCLAQGPKALAIAPWLAIMQDDHGPVINLYEAAEAKMTLPNGFSLKLVISGDFPNSAQVDVAVISDASANFCVRLRLPAWSKKTSVSVNGQDYHGEAGSYLSIDRTWNPGDTIRIEFDLSVRIIPAADGSERVAIMRGPVVLAQDSRLGKVDVPLLINEQNTVALKAVKPSAHMLETYQLNDGTFLCDYSSAGNEFCDDNKLCVWMPVNV